MVMAKSGSVDAAKCLRQSLLQDTGLEETLAKTCEIENAGDTLGPSLWQRWRDLPWKLEVACWTASCLLFMGIVAVLNRFQGRPLPDLPFSITVNAIVGLLATLGELLFMIPVASALVQSKWLRALRKRPMEEFWLIDEASRGTWGSLKLLMRGKGGLVAYIGALITIIALATNTFVQQVLRYETHYFARGEALMPIAKFLNGTGTATVNYKAGVSEGAGIDDLMLPALYTGVFSPSHSSFVATARCDSGNCTWSSYQNLAICNTCVNLTSQLNMTKVHVDLKDGLGGSYDTNFYTLPNGFGLTGVHPLWWDDYGAYRSHSLLNMTTSQSFKSDQRPAINPSFDSIAFTPNGSKFFTVFAVGSSPGTAPFQPSEDTSNSIFGPPTAFECALHFCVQNKTAVFANGSLSERLVATWTNDTLDITPILGDPLEDIVMQAPGNSEPFVIKRIAFEGTGTWLVNVLSGNATSIYSSSLADYLSSSDITAATYQAMNASSTGFPDLMDNLAESLSLALRKLPYQPDPVRGVSYSSRSYFIVRWAWLALPTVLLLSSLTLLVVVMHETKKRDLVPWGNNFMALLFHGCDKRPVRKARDRQNRMENEAGQYLLEFQSREDE